MKERIKGEFWNAKIVEELSLVIEALNGRRPSDAAKLFVASVRGVCEKDTERGLHFARQFIGKIPDRGAIRSIVAFQARAGHYHRALGYLELLEADEWTRTTRARLESSIRTQFGSSVGQDSDILALLPQLPDGVHQVELIALVAKNHPLDAQVVHRYLTAIFAQRRISLIAAILDTDIVRDPNLSIFHRVRLAHYRGESTFCARELLDRYRQISARSFLKFKMFNLAFEQAVRESDSTILLDMLSIVCNREVLKITPAIFMGACRILVESGYDDECKAAMDRRLQGLRPQQKLYFLEPAHALLGQRAGDLDPILHFEGWQRVVDRLATVYEAVDDADRRTFERYILSPLKALPQGERDRMDVRFSADQRDALIGRVKRELVESRPLSLIRLGDGEAYAYDAPVIEGIEPGAFVDDNNVRERHWWGVNISSEVRDHICADVRQAIANADILGIPSVYRVIRDLGGLTQRFGSSRAQRGLVVVLSELGWRIPLGNKTVTEERSHQILFDRQLIEELMAKAKKAVVVSCWSADDIALHSDVEMSYIRVTPHTQVRAAASQRDFESPLPEVYSQIADYVERDAGPGCLVLVSAGIIGKVFVDRARKAGAVALDIGSVADYLAGHKTRSVADVV